jgi:hypothetical protein
VTGTVFPDVAPADADWKQATSLLTPVDQGASGLMYKREDYFAPLGYGGVNGAKLRQLIYLMAHMNRPVVTACSVLSPQAPMTAVVGRHFGLPVTVMLGNTRRSTALRHPGIRAAVAAGARLTYIAVAYNPALQRAADAYQAQHGMDRVHYGITTPPGASNQDVAQFHGVSAPQVVSVPGHTRTLIVPFGSGNSVAAVLMGLAQYGVGAISRVVLVGIGPNRIAWLNARLMQIEQALERDIRGLFTWRTHGGQAGPPGTGPVLLDCYDLHGSGYVKYADRRPWHQDGIHFHPTYEGKVMQWLNQEAPHWYKPKDGTSLFWIIGSEMTA